MEQVDMPMQSDSLEEFAKAMCEVQKNDLSAKTDSENPYYKSRFANLPSVWKTIRKPLTDNGFSVIQSNVPFEGGVAIMTTLLHVSGQWMRGILPMPSEKRSPQAFGSVMSFERRYALMAIVGVSATDDDDDAEAAMERTKSSPAAISAHNKSFASKPPVAEPEVPELVDDVRTMIDYARPKESSQAFADLKAYKPPVVILNKEKTNLKVGKFEVMITSDGKKVWTDAPKFGSNDFDVSASVPCLVAALLREESAAFIGGKYDLVFTSKVDDDE